MLPLKCSYTTDMDQSIGHQTLYTLSGASPPFAFKCIRRTHKALGCIIIIQAEVNQEGKLV